MKNSKFLPIILAAALLLGALAVPAAAAQPTVAAPSALVLDRHSGEALYSKDADAQVAPTDTVKLMTALLAIEAVEDGKISVNDMVTVTEAMNTDLTEDSGRCGLQVGEQITLSALLQCMLIASGDDAANMVADYVGGSVSAFVKQMNARAAALGCTRTSFTNVHGAYSDGQFTTPQEMCRIAAECLSHERIKRICGTVAAELPETNLTAARTLRNTNPLICDESPYGPDYLYEDADGLKTGWNSQAGFTLIATASRNGVDLLCAVFGGGRSEAGRFTCFDDAAALFNWVFDNYGYQEVLKSTENIASVDVALGMNATYVNLRPATSITVLLPKNFNADDFEKNIRVYALENGVPVTAPVTAGQVLGEVTLTREGVNYGTVKLVASASVQLSRMQYIRQQIRETTRQRSFRLTVAILAVLFLLYLAWVIVYRVKRLRHVYAVRAVERERASMLAEAAMKHAPEPKSPMIRFFDRGGQTSAPAPLPEQEEPDGAQEELGDSRVIPLFDADGTARVTAPAAQDAPQDDLLASAMLVARVEPPPPPREETAEEKAERDYFEEFFRPKK